MKTVEARLVRAVEWGMIILLGLMFALTFAQIINRFIFGQSIIWIEEVVLNMFVWLVFLGIGIAVQKNAHLKMAELVSRLPAGFQGVNAKVMDLLTLAAFVVLLAGSVKWISGSMGKVSMTTGLPVFYYYLSIPSCCVLSIVFLLRKLIAGKDAP